jgi:hypothetical protein
VPERRKKDKSMSKYALRIGGTSDEFVSKIDPDDRRSVPPGSVDTVFGWKNPNRLFFDTEIKALIALELVGEIEGYHCTVERFDDDDN